ncbi:hypothetical protein K0U83_01425 [bacterium]|nr:hypothetical protein [bacterium]
MSGDTVGLTNAEYADMMRRRRNPGADFVPYSKSQVIIQNLWNAYKSFTEGGTDQGGFSIVPERGDSPTPRKGAFFVRIRIGAAALEIIRGTTCATHRVRDLGDSLFEILDLSRDEKIHALLTPVLAASDLVIIEEIPPGVATMKDDVFRHEKFRYDVVAHWDMLENQSWASRIKNTIHNPQRLIEFAQYPGEWEVSHILWQWRWELWGDVDQLFDTIDRTEKSDREILLMKIQHPKYGLLEFCAG